MSRPPWVWKSAPVTLIAWYGARSRVPCSVAASVATSQPIERGERRRVVGVPDGPRVLGRDEVGKGAAEREQAVVEDVPGDAAGLRQHLHRGFRVADGLVVEAFAARIDLDAALRHQRPGDQRALRHRPRPVALIAAEVGEPRAERLTPRDGAAVVADMAGEHRVAHLGQPLAHHRGVAAEAVAGQDQAAAGQMLHRVVGAPTADARARDPARRPRARAPALRSSSSHRQRCAAESSAAISAAPVRCGSACMRRTPWPG